MEFTVLIVLLPFATFIALGLGGKYMKPIVAGAVGTASLAVVTALAYTAAAMFFGGNSLQAVVPFEAVWLPLTDTLQIGMGVMLDAISVMMLLVITTVSLMVHIYSFGYMKGERGFQRYYAFLSLFTGAMLGLVVATNIFQMYVFWELVGVSSYLLIGFYYERQAAVAASKKAFIVTRFADLAFLIGILLYGYYGGTFAFAPLKAAAGGMLPVALGLMFIGGAGKSAMFPLHIWLPDAMEGPTPVSALIHAATMVVAGVFLVARMFPLFIGFAPETLHLTAYVGAFTALFAAVIACFQTDIKRVLAFSTISQIGFMITALGVAGYTAGLFHLFTHAFFKALLFLCAGAVIHAVHSNEMKDMGGLRKYLPITHITFLIACLAISGIPPFSGFFSKDEILAACFAFSPAMGVFMTCVAGLTAFYMFRLYYGIFWSKPYLVADGRHEPHEAPASMTAPLVFLAAATCIVGFLPFGKYVHFGDVAEHIDWVIAGCSVVVAIIGIATATFASETSLTRFKTLLRFPKFPVPVIASEAKQSHSWFRRAAYHRFYIDEVYQFITHRIIFRCISTPLAWFDRHIVDGFMNSLAWTTHATSDRIKNLQSGNVQQYSVVFLSGALALLLLLLMIY